jgi:gpW
MATCAQKQAWLSEAEEAWHALQTGSQEALISTGTKEVRYTPADSGRLAAYIGGLRAQVKACTGVADASIRRLIPFIPRDSGSSNCF